MTAPDGCYPCVVPHPYGGYSVVIANVMENELPAVRIGYHDQFITFRKACEMAQQEAYDGEYCVDPSVYTYQDQQRGKRV